MKMNTFAVNNIQDVDEFPGREALGNRALRLLDPEEELVRDIDEQRMSPSKLLATRFLIFISSRLAPNGGFLNIEKLNKLPIEEQQRIKKEFLGE
jgi:hypothetical protein